MWAVRGYHDWQTVGRNATPLEQRFSALTAVATSEAERASDPHLGENRIFQSWWQNWFNEPITLCSAEERAEMPGVLTAEQVGQIKAAPSPSFDRLFIQLMTVHHAGAVAMADKELRGDGDLRLRVMAHSIRHEQQGEIALMRNVFGLEAVSQAIRNMFADNVDTAPSAAP
jgi:uncharacterized protein (DUF305 family)